MLMIFLSLENEDPLVNASDLVEGDEADGGSEDDDAAAAVSRFGPMDRWLQNAPRVSQGKIDVTHAIIDGARASDVDLDNNPNPDDISTLTVSEEGNDDPVDSGSDDEKENCGVLAHKETNSLSVRSLASQFFIFFSSRVLHSASIFAFFAHNCCYPLLRLEFSAALHEFIKLFSRN